jgi:hypothetical protein
MFWLMATVKVFVCLRVTVEVFLCPLAYTLTQRETQKVHPFHTPLSVETQATNKLVHYWYHHRPPVSFVTYFVVTMTSFSDHSVDSLSLDSTDMTMVMVNQHTSAEHPPATFDLGPVHHAKLLLGMGRYIEALVELDRARAIQEQLVVGVSSHRRMDRCTLHNLAELYYWMAKAQCDLGEWPKALFAYRFAARISLLLGESCQKHEQEVSDLLDEETPDIVYMDIEEEFSKIAQSVCHEQKADDLMDAKDYQAARQEYLKAIVLEEQGWNGIDPSNDTVDLTWLWRKMALCTQERNKAEAFEEVCDSYQHVVQMAIQRGDLWYAQSKHHDAIGEYRKAALLGRSERTSKTSNATDEANKETFSSSHGRTTHSTKATDDAVEEVSQNSSPDVCAKKNNTMTGEGSPDKRNEQPSIAKTPSPTIGVNLPEDPSLSPSLWEHMHRRYNHVRTTFETRIVQMRKSSSFHWASLGFSGQDVVIYIVAVALAMVVVTAILFCLGALDVSMTALEVKFKKACRNTSAAVSPLHKQVALVPPRTMDQVRHATRAMTTKMRPLVACSTLQQYFVPVQTSWNSLWVTGVRVMDYYSLCSGKAWQNLSIPDLDLYSLRWGNSFPNWSMPDLRFSDWSWAEWSLPDVVWMNPFQYEFFDQTSSFLVHENVCQVCRSLVGPDRIKYCSRKPTVVPISTYGAVFHSSAQWMRDTGTQHWLVFLIVLVNLGLIFRLLLHCSFQDKETKENDSSRENLMVEHLQACLDQRLRHCLAHLHYQHSNGKEDIAMRDYRQMAAMEVEFMEQLQDGFAKIVQAAPIQESHDGGGTSTV